MNFAQTWACDFYVQLRKLQQFVCKTFLEIWFDCFLKKLNKYLLCFWANLIIQEPVLALWDEYIALHFMSINISSTMCYYNQKCPKLQSIVVYYMKHQLLIFGTFFVKKTHNFIYFFSLSSNSDQYQERQKTFWEIGKGGFRTFFHCVTIGLHWLVFYKE